MVKNQKLNQYIDLPKNNLNTKSSKCQLEHQMTKRFWLSYLQVDFLQVDFLAADHFSSYQENIFRPLSFQMILSPWSFPR